MVAFTYVQPRGRIFIPRFLKKRAQQRFLGGALLANNLYQRAWARRQIDAAESRLYPAIYLGPGIQRATQKL
jgi:hypothetical protein